MDHVVEHRRGTVAAVGVEPGDAVVVGVGEREGKRSVGNLLK